MWGRIQGHFSFGVDKFIKIFRITEKRGFYHLKVSAITLMVEEIGSMSYRRVNEIVVSRSTFHVLLLKFVFLSFPVIHNFIEPRQANVSKEEIARIKSVE